MDNVADSLLTNIHNKVRLDGILIRIIYARKPPDFAIAGTRVYPAPVRLLAVLQGRGDMDEVHGPELLDGLLRLDTRVLEWGDRRGDDGSTSAGQFSCDKGDALDVLVAVLPGEAKLCGKLGTDGLAEEKSRRAAALLVQCDL